MDILGRQGSIIDRHRDIHCPCFKGGLQFSFISLLPGAILLCDYHYLTARFTSRWKALLTASLGSRHQQPPEALHDMANLHFDWFFQLSVHVWLHSSATNYAAFALSRDGTISLELNYIFSRYSWEAAFGMGTQNATRQSGVNL